MVWRLLVLLICISSVMTWQRQFASWNCQTTSARFYFISYNDLGKGNVIHSKWFRRISLLDYIPMWAHFTTADSAVLYYSAGTTVPQVMTISIIHEFHETCHSVTFIVVVNSHQRWKQTRNRICFHLWCELTLALWCHSITWSPLFMK